MNDTMRVFPIAEYWWLYGAFLALICVLLFLDLAVFHKKSHKVDVKEAMIWTVVWISLAMVFNVGLYFFANWHFASDPRFLGLPGFDAAVLAKTLSLEFLTGYVVEKSLAVDNIFVFIVIFRYFAIPDEYQHRILFYGILGALIFRGIFIAIGSVLMEYEWVMYIFGAFLIWTGAKMFFANEAEKNPEDNFIMRLARKHLRLTPDLHGSNFFIRKNGVLYATPLFLTLILLEVSDIVFAVDSVPAIFAISKEPFIVFTSNIFAILGLRSMYFFLADIMHRFHFLKYGLAIILCFVGSKMLFLNHLFGGKFPISWSLGIIGSVLVGSMALSLMIKAPKTTPHQ